jgi:anti-sigma B factor antagonist
MSFLVEEFDKYTMITSNVEKLDASNASLLKDELTTLNKKGINTLVINLSNTKYCDSSGLSAILLANRICKDTNGQFILSGLLPNVQKLISISQLDKVLTITTTISEAVEVLSA